MSNKFYDQDDPTQPASPPAGNWQQGQQGKLVLGSFKDQPRSPQRRPYQYPQPAPGYPGQPQTPQNPYGAPGYQNPPAAYGQNRYAPPQPGAGAPYARRPGRQPRRRGCTVGCLAVLVLVGVIAVFAFTTAQRALAFGSAVSTQSPLSTQTGYMGTSDRVNLLILGYGGGSHDGANLTDSMVVISMQPQTQHTSLISVPRDLWVQNPPNSGNYTKLNAVYPVASKNGQQPAAGGDAAAQKVAGITGLDMKHTYWMTINFTGFRELIDSLGGVDVYVPDSFNACYPKNDDAAVDASWIKVQYNKGMQHMDGATAIAYARAREPLEVCGKGTSENLAELTDFGRSARQQIIMKSVLSKVKQVSAWPHLFDAMTALQHTIYTNMSLADLAEFTLKMDLNDPKTAHIGLSNANVLVDSQTNDGAYILEPRQSWAAVSAYVQQHLYQ
ncbi:hypothetical protein EPA93_19275 [Ktedonosporobacter rubrisoli]|uniref:Cell envelope-related transcriptional attenuator domain-containing protein n=1 Tax=Ktedonosporobacter rubrisoli TaxID=2509675 RepID=A0A4P6JRD7_KTERU|nr:LCP family protein [Ktedonosporobacter rubrisoli]QBD78018.1 hypothetical protein EPA93_19275 [Ktedonosporobacter rubrisoli]